MRRITFSPALSLLAVLALIGGVTLLVLAWWSKPLSEGAEAARGGNLKLALDRYAVLEKRFDQVPAVKQVLPDAYRASIANQLQVHYYLGEYDAVVEKAASSLSAGPVHFWAGCALFEKVRSAAKPDERVALLNRAEEEFRKALERQPEDWDTKFNYELTKNLLAEMKQTKAKPPPNQFLPLLRPKPTIVDRPVRRIG
jgi:hypothetical protein